MKVKTPRGESCGQSFKNAKNYNETFDTALIIIEIIEIQLNVKLCVPKNVNARLN